MIISMLEACFAGRRPENQQQEPTRYPTDAAPFIEWIRWRENAGMYAAGLDLVGDPSTPAPIEAHEIDDAQAALHAIELVRTADGATVPPFILIEGPIMLDAEAAAYALEVLRTPTSTRRPEEHAAAIELVRVLCTMLHLAQHRAAMHRHEEPSR